VPNFFTGYANQNGQTYVSTPPWNVAGVNYAVGINAAYVGNLEDPATAPLPAGCVFVAGSLPYVGCSNVNNLTINGYDFGHSVAGSVQLAIGTGVTGTLTITNNKFFNGPTLDPQLIDVDIDSDVTANTVMEYNYIDGNGPGIPTGKNISNVNYQSTGSLTFEYNALVNVTSKGLYYGTDSNVTILYNYGEGLGYGNPGHSDLITGGPATATSTMSNEEIGYNTFLVDNNTAGGTANIYVSNGVDGGTVLSANVDHNVDVSNYDFNPPNSNFTNLTSSYLIEAAHQDFGDLNFADNYFDPNGSFGCIALLSTATTVTYSGNVDMIDGSAANGAACDYSNGVLSTGGSGSSIGEGGGSAVPEPPTWAMMLMAWLVLGYSMSRRDAHCGLARPRMASRAGTGPLSGRPETLEPDRSGGRSDW
jgi:hypothetical protein